MAIDFTVPDLGENVTSGEVVNVLVHEGDVIESGQGVIEMETDKAVVEVPCPHGGRVTKIHVAKGETVRIGMPVLTLEDGVAAKGSALKSGASDDATAAEAATSERKSAPGAQAPARRPPAAKPTPRRTEEPQLTAPFNPRSAPRQGVPAGPGLRRLARELGVDIGQVQGTGPSGRITRSDVEKAAGQPAPKSPAARPRTPAARPAAEESTDADRWGPVRREPMTQIRKTIAAHMIQAADTIPHVTHVDEADVTDLDRIRRTWDPEETDPPIKVTMLPFIIKAVTRALNAYPRFNASFDAENETIVYKQYISIGIAVDTERGLIVPVLRDVDRMSILEIASAAAAAAERIRSARFDLEELRGGTFTISNVGAIGGIYSTPIINYPEVAILLVGRARMQPVYLNGSFEPRRMLPLNLAYDHRVLDGAQAAHFMNEIVAGLEAPGTLLLAP